MNLHLFETLSLFLRIKIASLIKKAETETTKGFLNFLFVRNFEKLPSCFHQLCGKKHLKVLSQSVL